MAHHTITMHTKPQMPNGPLMKTAGVDVMANWPLIRLELVRRLSLISRQRALHETSIILLL